MTIKTLMSSPTYTDSNGITITGTGYSLNNCRNGFDQFGNPTYFNNGRMGTDVNLLANTVRPNTFQNSYEKIQAKIEKEIERDNNMRINNMIQKRDRTTRSRVPLRSQSEEEALDFLEELIKKPIIRIR